jgi:hypothetical protein
MSDFRNKPQYSIAAFSGLLTSASFVAGAPLLSLRWTDASRLLLLYRLRAKLVVTSQFTALQEIGLDAITVSSFTVSDTGGTVLVPLKKRSILPASLVGDLRVTNTSPLGAGTRTLDAQPFLVSNGITHDPNAAGGTAQVIAQVPQLVLDMKEIEYPRTLSANEGILIRNTTLFPAAGSARFEVEMAWAEVSSY